jgi:hypothetical protein
MNFSPVFDLGSVSLNFCIQRAYRSADRLSVKATGRCCVYAYWTGKLGEDALKYFD